MIPWLGPHPDFPAVEQALAEPAGLLAAGGCLEPEWILGAYRSGIFPWYSPGDPILWWSPDPRMVLFPSELRVTRSLARTLRKRPFDVRCDTAFGSVMAACAAPRSYADGTWISSEMQAAYTQLHALGWAHSVECWQGDALVGGLYGVAIGRVFYGESMFHIATDASKIAFAHLARWLEMRGIAVIDCQMSTPHLASLGAREIPRAQFVAGLQEWTRAARAEGRWPAEAMMKIDWSERPACHR